jgi:hypothetical protein
VVQVAKVCQVMVFHVSDALVDFSLVAIEPVQHNGIFGYWDLHGSGIPFIEICLTMVFEASLL